MEGGTSQWSYTWHSVSARERVRTGASEVFMDLSSLPGYVVGFPHAMGVRDLGGQRAADGRLVRHGMLFRGAALIDLDEFQRAIVESWGLRKILDLRADGEVMGRADFVPATVSYERIPGMYSGQFPVDFSPEGIERIMEREGDSETFMSGLYSSMMFDNPAVHRLVEWVASGETPVYFHCTAGKDRTGVCAAVLLMLLGVPDKDIMAEFLLTNEYRAAEIGSMPKELHAWMGDITPEVWRRMAGVDGMNLQAAFDAVDARYPTREEYFRVEFGLDAGRLRALRDHLLVG